MSAWFREWSCRVRSASTQQMEVQHGCPRRANLSEPRSPASMRMRVPILRPNEWMCRLREGTRRPRPTGVHGRQRRRQYVKRILRRICHSDSQFDEFRGGMVDRKCSAKVRCKIATHLAARRLSHYTLRLPIQGPRHGKWRTSRSAPGRLSCRLSQRPTAK